MSIVIQKREDFLSVKVANHSKSLTVRVRAVVSVKGSVLRETLEPAGMVIRSYWNNGFNKCVPYSECTNQDFSKSLLSQDGTLELNVKVNLLSEKHEKNQDFLSLQATINKQQATINKQEATISLLEKRVEGLESYNDAKERRGARRKSESDEEGSGGRKRRSESKGRVSKHQRGEGCDAGRIGEKRRRDDDEDPPEAAKNIGARSRGLSKVRQKVNVK